jgi:hypothetical protein
MADKALALYRAELQKLLGAIRRGELELEAAHSQLATDVIAKLREATKTRRTTAQLEQLFDAEFAKTFPKRVRIVRTNIREGADAGPAVGKRTFRAVLGEDVVDSQVRETAGAMAEAADRIAGRITVDKVGLTKRMRRVDREVSQGMAQEVQRGIKQQRGILGAARKIERIDPRSVELPKYLQELEAAARAGDKGAVRDIAKSYTKRIAQLGEVQTDGTFLASKYSLKSATKKFVADVQTASEKQLDGVVKRYVKEKLAYQANRIARSETVEAMRQSYVKQMADKAGVVCFQWTLSNRHASALHGGSREDVCDILANQNAYGLGPGRYPAAHVPKLPHPNCCPPGCLVETSEGNVPIERVVPGMLVRTHSGALRRVLRLSAVPWRGELVVATIGDKRLVATPEHPVLTTRGWQTAEQLQPGDRVFTRVDAQHAPADRSEVALFGEVSDALAPAAMPVARVDLDSEQKLAQTSVDVVLADGQLRDRQVPVLSEGSEHARLVSSRHSAALFGVGSSEQRRERLGGAAHSSMRSSSHSLALGGRATCASDDLLLGCSALDDAGALQHAVDGPAHDADALGYFQDAQLLHDVEPDNLLRDGIDARMGRAGSPSPAASGCSATLDSVGGHSRSRDLHLLSFAAQLDAARAQHLDYVVVVEPEALDKRAHRKLLVNVRTHEVVDVDHALVDAFACAAAGHFYLSTVTVLERVAYDGPVHNFAVDVDESYVVDGVVAHNCLCTVHAVIDRSHFSRSADEGRVPADMQDHESPDATGWLKQNPDKARAILGPTRHALLEKGVPVLEPTGQIKRVSALVQRSSRKAGAR